MLLFFKLHSFLLFCLYLVGLFLLQKMFDLVLLVKFIGLARARSNCRHVYAKKDRKNPAQMSEK